MATMKVLVNGVLTEREVSHYVYWNGYKDLAFPKLEQCESIHWTAGSRVPEISGGL